MSRSAITTDALIAQLAAAPAPKPLRQGLFLLAMGVTLGAGVAMYLWSMGMRPDVIRALVTPVTLAKTALPLMLMAVALAASLRLARPGARAVVWPLAVPAACAAALLALAVPDVAAGQVLPAVLGQTAVKCLTSILTLAALPLVSGVALLRRGASTRPALSGAWLGMAAGAGAAAGYALSCGEDSPLFYLTWYGLAIAGATAAGAVIGARWLRW